jgi:hypothetical protein
MWIDESDATQLSQRLHLGPRELVEAIGGPWHIVQRSPEGEIAAPGTLFVGRAGPSVAILVGDDPIPEIVVGTAEGNWPDPGTLEWAMGRPVVRLQSVAPQAPDADVAVFLGRLGEAVDDAFAAKRPSLVICRYCGVLVAPEHALGDEMCHGCGSRMLGIVY